MLLFTFNLYCVASTRRVDNRTSKAVKWNLWSLQWKWSKTNALYLLGAMKCVPIHFNSIQLLPFSDQCSTQRKILDSTEMWKKRKNSSMNRSIGKINRSIVALYSSPARNTIYVQWSSLVPDDSLRNRAILSNWNFHAIILKGIEWKAELDRASKRRTITKSNVLFYTLYQFQPLSWWITVEKQHLDYT